MADEYIKRADLLAEYDRGHQGTPGRARELIANAPSADVQPVRHGRWMDCKPYNPEFNGYKCSECGARYQGFSPDNYCPNCGAIMDKEAQP